jgi:hypothetical protein
MDRVLEKLTITRLVKKFPALYGSRRFIIILKTASHRLLSQARWIQSTLSQNKNDKMNKQLACMLLSCSPKIIQLPEQLTPYRRTIIQKLTVAQLVKKFRALYGTEVFITVFTRNRHWPQSWARLVQSTFSHPVSRSILILSSKLRLRLLSSLQIFLLEYIHLIVPVYYMPGPFHFYEHQYCW